MADLEQMKQKYASVPNLINQSGVRLSHMHIQDNKLFLQGAAGSEQIKNRIWDQIKQVNPTADDIICDLTVDPAAAPAPSPKPKTYSVAAGDSLSKIAKHVYGNANQYMKIFAANKDKLSDPDKIKLGRNWLSPTEPQSLGEHAARRPSAAEHCR